MQLMIPVEFHGSVVACRVQWLQKCYSLKTNQQRHAEASPNSCNCKCMTLGLMLQKRTRARKEDVLGDGRTVGKQRYFLRKGKLEKNVQL